MRSLTTTSDGRVLLASVHVGGIARSTDGGLTWNPTIDIHQDVHEVRAHAADPALAIAAAATGLCISRDGGATWAVERDGLHATYCSAVAFAGDTLLVAAATDHFSPRGAVHARPVDGTGRLVPLGAGLPRWLAGIVDTGCLASHASALTLVDKAGNLYLSTNEGRRWTRRADDLPGPSALWIT